MHSVLLMRLFLLLCPICSVQKRLVQPINVVSVSWPLHSQNAAAQQLFGVRPLSPHAAWCSARRTTEEDCFENGRCTCRYASGFLPVFLKFYYLLQTCLQQLKVVCCISSQQIFLLKTDIICDNEVSGFSLPALTFRELFRALTACIACSGFPWIHHDRISHCVQECVSAGS